MRLESTHPTQIVVSWVDTMGHAVVNRQKDAAVDESPLIIAEREGLMPT